MMMLLMSTVISILIHLMIWSENGENGSHKKEHSSNSKIFTGDNPIQSGVPQERQEKPS